jgi:hypothetical protein
MRTGIAVFLPSDLFIPVTFYIPLVTGIILCTGTGTKKNATRGVPVLFLGTAPTPIFSMSKRKILYVHFFVH